MTEIFSHAPGTFSTPDAALTDIAARVVVPAVPADAFRGFADNVHLWWPAAELSVWGGSSHFEFDGGALVETSVSNYEEVWAETIEQVPAEHLVLSWRHCPGTWPTTAVRVEFAPASTLGGSDVAVTHSGWAGSTTGVAELRSRYDRFWPLALGRFARFMGAAPELP